MRSSVGRIAVVAACLVALTGCVTTTADNPFAKIVPATEEAAKDGAASGEATGSVAAMPNAPEADATGSVAAAPNAPETDTTGSVAAPPPTPLDSPPATPEILGEDPNDDLSIGKKYFRQGSYGLAERHFRKAVELHPRDAESWVGLAAAYDRLRRFDLADRAYASAIRIIGRTPELLNNQGFSYLLRGEYRRARETLLAAQAKDPKSPYIANNLKLLEISARKAKTVN